MQFGIRGQAGNTWGGAPIHPATQHTLLTREFFDREYVRARKTLRQIEAETGTPVPISRTAPAT